MLGAQRAHVTSPEGPFHLAARVAETHATMLSVMLRGEGRVWMLLLPGTPSSAAPSAAPSCSLTPWPCGWPPSPPPPWPGGISCLASMCRSTRRATRPPTTGAGSRATRPTRCSTRCAPACALPLPLAQTSRKCRRMAGPAGSVRCVAPVRAGSLPSLRAWHACAAPHAPLTPAGLLHPVLADWL